MFKLEIKTGGAAFMDPCNPDIQDADTYEVRRILRVVSGQIESGRREGAIMDINGNKVGRWSYD